MQDPEYMSREELSATSINLDEYRVMRDGWTSYLTYSDGVLRHSHLLLWVGLQHIRAPYMTRYTLGEIRVHTIEYTLCIEGTHVWMARYRGDGRYYVGIKNMRDTWRKPEELVTMSDHAKAKAMCEARAMHLISTELKEPGVSRLEDITQRQHAMLVRDPLIRRLDAFANLAHVYPEWAAAPQQTFPTMFVAPAGEIMINVPDRSDGGRRGVLYPDLFWKPPPQ